MLALSYSPPLVASSRGCSATEYEPVDNYAIDLKALEQQFLNNCDIQLDPEDVVQNEEWKAIGTTHRGAGRGHRFDEAKTYRLDRWSDYPSIAAMPINPGIDMMCHKQT
ncbi:MAG TPA: hypothetical protein VNU00_07820 [Candidatus Binataceae bacterium]|nr:hypothetical protein [Candidatus Binataceae bacterium]